MTDTSKPIVRLSSRLAAKRAQKAVAAPSNEQTIKLAIRLNEGVNEALRTLIRYRGDLSTMALEALDSVDLTRAPLVSAQERMVPGYDHYHATATTQTAQKDRRRSRQLNEYSG